MNIIELAKQADLDWASGWTLEDDEPNRFETFANLVAAQEREACAKLVVNLFDPADNVAEFIAEKILARGTT